MDGRKLNVNEKSDVLIQTFYKGENQSWKGNLERVDGVIDPITRMINLIAIFKNDFIEKDKPTLPIGLFVEAEIDGVLLQDVFKIPSSAISAENTLFVVDKNNSLELRKLKILKKYNDYVIVKDDLKVGERIVISKLSNASTGMTVNPIYQ